MAVRRYALLDRDGTVIVDGHFLSSPHQVELLPGAVEGLRKMRALGLGLVIVSNQSGIGRGLFDHQAVAGVHQRMTDLLADADICLDGIYYCPHAPEDACDCRKPRTGMVDRAAADLNFDPCRAFIIGDKRSDVALGRALGATTILVRTGYGETELSAGAQPDHVVADLTEAAEIIEQIL